MKDLFGNETYEASEKPTGKYKIFRFINKYRVSENNKKCKNCKHCTGIKGNSKNYYKCLLQGVSSCASSDISLRNVCDLWEREE